MQAFENPRGDPGGMRTRSRHTVKRDEVCEVNDVAMHGKPAWRDPGSTSTAHISCRCSAWMVSAWKIRAMSRTLVSMVCTMCLLVVAGDDDSRDRREHAGAMSAVEAGLSGVQGSLMAGLAATSAKLKALEVASTMRDTDEDHFKAVKGSAGGDADGEPSSAALLRLLKGEAHRDQRKEVKRELHADSVKANKSLYDILSRALLGWRTGHAASEGPDEVPANDSRNQGASTVRGRGGRSEQWGYDGDVSPESWGDAFPQCREGKMQSPIDLDRRGGTTRTEDIESFTVLEWEFGRARADGAGTEPEGGALDDTSPPQIFIRLPLNSRFKDPDAGSEIDNVGSTHSGARRLLAGVPEESRHGRVLQITNLGHATLFAGGSTFVLDTVVTHTPSEHTIGAERADLEVQLVHRPTRAASASPGGSQDGATALVVSLLFSTKAKVARRAPPPDFLSALAAAVPEVGHGEGRHHAPVRGFSLHELAKELRPYLGSYYRYEGSLTRPPCTEGVVWFVVSEPLGITEAQLAALQEVEGNNARPLQPLNGRQVHYVP